jgi:hypothetical protein
MIAASFPSGMDSYGGKYPISLSDGNERQQRALIRNVERVES